MKNTDDLKRVLFDEMDALIKGESTPQRANGVSKLASQIIYACRVEVENKREEINLSKLIGEPRINNIDVKTVTVPSLSFGGKK